MTHPIQETAKHAADTIAGVVTVGAVAELLPPIAAIFTILWTGLRIYIIIETRVKTGKWK